MFAQFKIVFKAARIELIRILSENRVSMSRGDVQEYPTFGEAPSLALGIGHDDAFGCRYISRQNGQRRVESPGFCDHAVRRGKLAGSANDACLLYTSPSPRDS